MLSPVRSLINSSVRSMLAKLTSDFSDRSWRTTHKESVPGLSSSISLLQSAVGSLRSDPAGRATLFSDVCEWETIEKCH